MYSRNMLKDKNTHLVERLRRVDVVENGQLDVDALSSPLADTLGKCSDPGVFDKIYYVRPVLPNICQVICADVGRSTERAYTLAI